MQAPTQPLKAVPEETEEMPIRGGRERGLILHKLMEEVLAGETAGDEGPLQARASETHYTTGDLRMRKMRRRGHPAPRWPPRSCVRCDSQNWRPCGHGWFLNSGSMQALSKAVRRLLRPASPTLLPLMKKAALA